MVYWILGLATKRDEKHIHANTNCIFMVGCALTSQLLNTPATKTPLWTQGHLPVPHFTLRIISSQISTIQIWRCNLHDPASSTNYFSCILSPPPFRHPMCHPPSKFQDFTHLQFHHKWRFLRRCAQLIELDLFQNSARKTFDWGPLRNIFPASFS